MCIKRRVSCLPKMESQVGIVMRERTSIADSWLTADISPFSTSGCTPSKTGTLPPSVSRRSLVDLESILYKIKHQVSRNVTVLLLFRNLYPGYIRAESTVVHPCVSQDAAIIVIITYHRCTSCNLRVIYPKKKKRDRLQFRVKIKVIQEKLLSSNPISMLTRISDLLFFYYIMVTGHPNVIHKIYDQYSKLQNGKQVTPQGNFKIFKNKEI